MNNSCDSARATAAAKSNAKPNYGVTHSYWARCHDAAALPYQPEAPNNTCISYSPDSTAPTSVRVVIPAQSVSTSFAGILGRDHIAVSAAAQIQITPGSPGSPVSA